ncbi:MAG: hypothetical protein AAGD22_07895 [Verrucomicrobiota bacterium]
MNRSGTSEPALHTIHVLGFVLASSVLLSSCASPKVKETRLPKLESPDLIALANSEKLTDGTKRFLIQKNLLEAYRANPEQTIIALQSEPSSSSSPAARVALAEMCGDTGEVIATTNPSKAAGFFISAANFALPVAQQSSNNELALKSYNWATARAARTLFDSGHDWSQPADIPGPGKTWRLDPIASGPGYLDPARADSLWYSANLQLKGFDDFPRKIRPGFGAAMIGHQGYTPERAAENPFLAPVGMSLPATATLDFRPDGKSVRLAFHDSMIKEKAQLGGRTVTLRSDFTAPLATLYSYQPKHNVGFAGMLHPDKYEDRMGLFELEPYRSDQIPVVFVHGLMSSPGTWLKALNILIADPKLRERYQLLAFYYPTGYPIAHNASSLRKKLATYQQMRDPGKRNPNMKKMMLIGHSMGGLLSSMQIRDSGDTFIKKVFNKPLDQIESLSEERQAEIEEIAIFEANPNITRTVFVAAPHRGSNIAASPIGKLGADLIKFSTDLLSGQWLTTQTEGLTEAGKELARHTPNSITELAPDAPVLVTILETPVQPSTTIHSIIGNHNNREPLKESGDSVVPYWSSHLDEAASEKVVHANHVTITGNLEAIEETRRLLYLHAGLEYPGPDPTLTQADTISR